MADTSDWEVIKELRLTPVNSPVGETTEEMAEIQAKQRRLREEMIKRATQRIVDQTEGKSEVLTVAAFQSSI